MLTAVLFAVALTGASSDTTQAVSVIARTPAPAASPANAGEGETRRVCRFERATGSNLQQRVCRDVARQGAQDQQTREFMRNLQRIRFPDGGAAPTPAGPAG